jgi:hypothetical protein
VTHGWAQVIVSEETPSKNELQLTSVIEPGDRVLE